MKTKRLNLEKLSVKSFTTQLNDENEFTIKGGGTEDNTLVAGSFQDCKPTVEPWVPGTNQYEICIDNPNDYNN